MIPPSAGRQGTRSSQNGCDKSQCIIRGIQNHATYREKGVNAGQLGFLSRLGLM